MSAIPVSIFLHQGEVCIRSEPAVVTTVLGSCIAVTMFSRNHATGAICHAVMPEGSGRGKGHYVDTAIEEMLEAFANRGMSKKGLTVKLFGGARMFTGRYSGSEGSVGDRNIRKARKLIKEHKLDLTASDVGGYEGRKILFYPHNGAVWVKKLHKREIV